MYLFHYKVLAELAVIFAQKMEKTYKDMFFGAFKEKFLKDLEFLDQ
jgi:hypothetical protein